MPARCSPPGSDAFAASTALGFTSKSRALLKRRFRRIPFGALHFQNSHPFLSEASERGDFREFWQCPDFEPEGHSRAGRAFHMASSSLNRRSRATRAQAVLLSRYTIVSGRSAWTFTLGGSKHTATLTLLGRSG
jgi:hypothetical protein